MIQPVQGRATLGLSPLVSGAESKVPTSDAWVRPRVGKTEQTVVGNDGGKVKMPKAVLPFGDWPPGSEKVDERTGAIQEYKTLSVADQLQARTGANKEVDKSAAPGGGEEAKGEPALLGEEASSMNQEGKTDEARRSESSKSLQGPELSLEDLKKVEKMKVRDQEVRQHEQAHKAMGGAYTGSIRYEYKVGPDGKRYVTEGEVPVSLSSVRGSPERTISKMKTIRAAAMSPSRPSVADIQVAMKASRLMQRAQQEIAVERYQQAQNLEGKSAVRELVTTAIDKKAANNDGTVTPTETQSVNPAAAISIAPPDPFVHNYTLQDFAKLSSSYEGSPYATMRSNNEGAVSAILHSPANNNIAVQMQVAS
jgi:hypothetical protein